jgi:hypothetical protein
MSIEYLKKPIDLLENKIIQGKNLYFCNSFNVR